jgi:acyl carrier protein
VASVDERVRALIARHLGVSEDRVVDSASFVEDLGASATTAVGLIDALQEEFEVEISDETAEAVATVRDAIDIVEGAQ